MLPRFCTRSHRPVALDAALPLKPARASERELTKPVALVVDDDPDIAPLVRAALEPYAITIDSASDGAAALARLREYRYDLMLLDLSMPGLNGFDVLAALRKQSRHLPVIVITGHANDEALARSFGYGADDFLIKPFRPDELGMRAYRLLAPSRAR